MATPAAPADVWARVEAQALSCTRCRLCEQRNKVVFGSGHRSARVMFVGEAPGRNEDRQGLPFVGRAGELLEKILGAMGLRRDDVYITNVVKCWPPGNRGPEPDEVEACRGFLEQQIALIDPEVIVALGRYAAVVLTGIEAPIGVLRGRVHDVDGRKLVATYHPAACLRNEEYKRPVWDDMQVVMEILGLPNRRTK